MLDQALFFKESHRVYKTVASERMPFAQVIFRVLFIVHNADFHNSYPQAALKNVSQSLRYFSIAIQKLRRLASTEKSGEKLG
jgi:hypothetical protein